MILTNSFKCRIEVENLDMLQSDIDNRLARTTQYIFYKHILLHLNPAVLQANVTPITAAKLYLKWILYNDSYSSLEESHRLGHSSYTPMFNAITYQTEKFSTDHITMHTYEKRRRWSQRYHPELLRGRFTGHLDGTHCKAWCWTSRGEDPKCLFSHKSRKSALTTQALLLPNLIVGWLSYTDGAATHDKTATELSTLLDEMWLEQRDLFSADSAYQNLEHIEPPMTQREAEMSEDNAQYARQVYEYHRKIEVYFGDLKRKFEILGCYRHQKQFFNRIMRLAVALQNIERLLLHRDLPPLTRFEGLLTFTGELVDPFEAPAPPMFREENRML